MFFGTAADSNFHLVFRDLLSLHEGGKIDHLIQEAAPAPLEPAKKYSFNPLQLLRIDHPELAAEQIKKQKTLLFQKKICNWTTTLTKQLFNSMYIPASLASLQKVVMKIFTEQKIHILENKLTLEGLCDSRTQEDLDHLNMMIFYTLNTPQLEKLKFQPSQGSSVLIKKEDRYLKPSNKTKKNNKQSRLRKSKSDSALDQLVQRENQRIDQKKLHKIISTQGIQLHYQQKANELSYFNPSWGADWKEKLLSAFKDLKEEEAVIAVGGKLGTFQVLQVINGFMEDQAQEWKMLYLFGSLKPTTFVEILPAFDGIIISKLNEIFRRSSIEAKEWFQSAFHTHRTGLTKSCNRMKDEIDALAQNFRDDIKGYAITATDLDRIKELEDRILLIQECTYKKLQPLIKGIIRHRETNHLLFEDMPKEYAILLSRVMQGKNFKDLPPGSLWPIIYRNIFEDGDHDDEDEAFNMLGEWGITNFNEYKEVGLFGLIDDVIFEELSKPERKPNLFTIAYRNLAKLEIETIADLKRLNIFNQTLLKNYLGNKDNLEKLTSWSKSEVLL